MSDLSRIGQQPDCQHPKCPLLACTRSFDVIWGGYKFVCSLHADWHGETT